MPDAFSLLKSTISIHALRVEGDLRRADITKHRANFYPRPPGGGRPRKSIRLHGSIHRFLSTPSGWRATALKTIMLRRSIISIHALRVEGDINAQTTAKSKKISIHALRVEGDSKNGQSFRLFLRKREKNLPL